MAKLSSLCEPDRRTIAAGSPDALSRPYLGLEQVEKETGRIIQSWGAEGGASFAFDDRHVLYGKLRPKLNKVVLPDHPGRCTTELIPLLPKADVRRDVLAWLLRHPDTVHRAAQKATGGRMPRADMDDLLSFEVPLPPPAEQARVAALLEHQMALVEQALATVARQIEAVDALPGVFLREAFESAAFPIAASRPLETFCTLLPARSVTAAGDREVLAVTSGCLSEAGFRSEGVKSARMRSADVEAATVEPGEVLVARSNTPELVGRAALYKGKPANVVAPDLILRLWPDRTQVVPEYLARFLSYRFVTGRWRDVATGASGSMKKIKRPQLLAESVPLPSRDVQWQIASVLEGQMTHVQSLRAAFGAEQAYIEDLRRAHLREAFAG